MCRSPLKLTKTFWKWRRQGYGSWQKDCCQLLKQRYTLSTGAGFWASTASTKTSDMQWTAEIGDRIKTLQVGESSHPWKEKTLTLGRMTILKTIVSCWCFFLCPFRVRLSAMKVYTPKVERRVHLKPWCCSFLKLESPFQNGWFSGFISNFKGVSSLMVVAKQQEGGCIRELSSKKNSEELRSDKFHHCFGLG